MFAEIGSYDAKTKLPELLREVEKGQRYTITLRGRPVADLVPSESASQADAHAAIAAMKSFEKITGVSEHDIENWISEGRR